MPKKIDLGCFTQHFELISEVISENKMATEK